MGIGIFDPKGSGKNPLTGKDYTIQYETLAKKWSVLPAYENGKEIVETIRSNQVILITSGTGSGKTVLIPKFALHAVNYAKNIAITLPKRIITQSTAEYAAATLDVELGKDVGYQFRGAPVGSRSRDTKLLYCTDGTIVARLAADPRLNDFSMVIIDEAHERKTQIDLLLLLLKQVLIARDDFKLIIMSATINAQIFVDYFQDFDFGRLKLSGVPNYPVESIYLDTPVELDYITKGVEIIKNIIEKTDDGDILFFVTSSGECTKVCEKLMKDSQYPELFCVGVFSNMQPELQELAKDKSLYKKNGYTRKLVISTNVAESSLTIDGIIYVIDSGYALMSNFDVSRMADILLKRRITQAQVKQRMGRTGRTEPGTCYHLYTEKEYERMSEYPKPEIKNNNIINEIIKLLRFKETEEVDDALELFSKMIEPPTPSILKMYLRILELNRIIQKKERIQKELQDSPDSPIPIDNASTDGSTDAVQTTSTQNETTQNETRQNETRQNETRKNETIQNETIQNETIQNETTSIASIYKNHCYKLTEIGKFVSQMSRIRLESALMIQVSIRYDCLKEICLLVGILESLSYTTFHLYNKKPDKTQSFKSLSKFYSKKSDHITILRIFIKFFKLYLADPSQALMWCEEYNLKYERFERAIDLSKACYKTAKDIIEGNKVDDMDVASDISNPSNDPNDPSNPSNDPNDPSNPSYDPNDTYNSDNPNDPNDTNYQNISSDDEVFLNEEEFYKQMPNNPNFVRARNQYDYDPDSPGNHIFISSSPSPTMDDETPESPLENDEESGDSDDSISSDNQYGGDSNKPVFRKKKYAILKTITMANRANVAIRIGKFEYKTLYYKFNSRANISRSSFLKPYLFPKKCVFSTLSIFNNAELILVSEYYR